MKSPHRRQKNELNEQSDRNEAFYMPKMLTLYLLLICQLKCDRIDPSPPGVLDRTPDSFYSIPGFTIFRRDRQTKNGGGVLAFVTDELSVSRRKDMEDLNLEILWLVAPFKSKRSLLLAGVYRPPSSTKADDIALENNIEKADLSNKEIILAGDFNIDATNPETYKKHRLSNGLITMNFKQLVTETTRPVSATCLDHILSNKPQRMHNIVIPDIGLSDHLPVFAVRQYSRNNE